jgi:hypothetical protein
MKLKRAELLLFLAPVVLLAGVWLHGQGQSDLLDEVLRSEAGPNAVNCGIAYSTEDKLSIDACAVAAYKAKNPFFYRNPTRVVSTGPLLLDSYRAEGVIALASGWVTLQSYQSRQFLGIRHFEEVADAGEMDLAIRNGKGAFEVP